MRTQAMPGSVGEKIGEGAWSDVYAWAPGQVVKLFKAGYQRRHSWWEARMTRAAFAAGAPAPEVFDEVTVDERFGVVLQRLDGPTLTRLFQSRVLTAEQTGVILATVALSVHKTAPPPEILSLRERDARSTRPDGPEHILAGIVTLIERLAPGDGLCHGDLHPGNVIMTADGPRLIDWGGATRAPAAFDLACCHVVLSELAPERVPDPKRPRAINAATQSEYARLVGMSPAALTAAMEPYLPIVYGRILRSPVGSQALRERLLQRLETALMQP
jgi:tRNA A-37 threonylcarbamoyl transferase component Bud32